MRRMCDDHGPGETATRSETRSTLDSGDEGRSEAEDHRLDEVLQLLASERRRTALSALRDRRGEPVPVDLLVDLVAERERPPPGPASHRELVEIDLHHVHLPRLADAGVIAYDPVEETVRYEEAELLESLLAVANADEEEWP